MTEDAKKKRKKYSSSYSTLGNPELDAERFNQSFSGFTDTSITTSSPADCGSGVNMSMGACESLTEDILYSAKIDDNIELPDFIHLLNRDDIITALENVEPAETFKVGYVTPLFFYKALVEYFTIIKCTELEGHTGYDYIESNVDDDEGKDDRLDLAKKQIDRNGGYGGGGIHADRNPLANYTADYSANYELTNKTVRQHEDGKLSYDGDLSTILFYPTIGQKPKVKFYITLGDIGSPDWNKKWMGITEEYILKVMNGIYQKLVNDNKATKRWNLNDLKAKIHGEFARSNQTISSVELNAENKLETRSRFNKGRVSISKDPVRALYTNQIYFIKTSQGSGGNSLMEELNTNISDLSLDEKRETKRYYVRPQDIFCANKADVLKALIDVANSGENCTVYSLKSLDDHNDIGKLNNNDIIYYYDENVLYDKNHELVMDYDLFIKHEEERKKFANPDAVSKQEFRKEYGDRMTSETVVEDYEEDGTYSANGYKIYNVPQYATSKAYLVVKYIYEDDQLWFYGAYDDSSSAYKCVDELNRYGSSAFTARVIKNTNLQKENLLHEGLSLDGFKLALDRGEELVIGETILEDGFGWINFNDGEPYSHSIVELTKDNDKYYINSWDVSASGEEKEGQIKKVFNSFDDAVKSINQLNLQNCPYQDIFNNPNSELSGDGFMNQEFESFDLNKKFNRIYESFDEAFEDEPETCVICGEEIIGYGNNAAPYKDGKCCDACNLKFVIPARLEKKNAQGE